MTEYSVTIQRDQAADAARDALEAGLVRVGRELLGDGTDAAVRWTVVEPTYMFTEGKPSTSSIVVRSVAPELGVADREPFMRAVCDLWTSTTGCTDHEIMVTTVPGPLPF